MITAAPVDGIKRSPFPFSPLRPHMIPGRLMRRSVDYANGFDSVDKRKLLRNAIDLEDRARIDATDLEHVTAKAMTYAGALGQIDALHIEWGGTEWDVLEVWTRLGRILREAGI